MRVFIIIAISVLPFLSFSQNQKDSVQVHYYDSEVYKPFKAKGLSLGYNYNFHDTISSNTKYHFIDVEFYNSKFRPHRHGQHVLSYSIGNSFGLINFDEFTIIPHISGSVTFTMISLGSEFHYVTDFDSGSFLLSPFLSLGMESLSIQLKYNAVLGDNNPFQINNTTVSLTMPLALLKGDVFLEGRTT